MIPTQMPTGTARILYKINLFDVLPIERRGYIKANIRPCSLENLQSVKQIRESTKNVAALISDFDSMALK